MITIESASGRAKATLEDVNGAIAVVYWERPKREGLYRQVSREWRDLPFHVVADDVHRAIYRK